MHAVDMMQPKSRYQTLDVVCESVDIKFSYIITYIFKRRCNSSNTNGLLCVNKFKISFLSSSTKEIHDMYTLTMQSQHNKKYMLFP